MYLGSPHRATNAPRKRGTAGRESLAAACVSPPLALASTTAANRAICSYAALPLDAPEELYLSLAGDSLASYLDEEAQTVTSFIDQLGCFDLMRGIGSSNQVLDPRFLDLAQNFPNPFHPESGTTLRFELRDAQRVWLGIYDVSGREVRRIMAGEALTPGVFARTWDLKDQTGEAAAAGVYFARLESEGGRPQIVKMTLIH